MFILPIEWGCINFQNGITDVKKTLHHRGQKEPRWKSICVGLGETIKEDQWGKVCSVRHSSLQAAYSASHREGRKEPGGEESTWSGCWVCLRFWIQLSQPFTEQHQARHLHLSVGGSSSLKDSIKGDECALGKCVGPPDLSLLPDIDKKKVSLQISLPPITPSFFQTHRQVWLVSKNFN